MSAPVNKYFSISRNPRHCAVSHQFCTFFPQLFKFSIGLFVFCNSLFISTNPNYLILLPRLLPETRASVRIPPLRLSLFGFRNRSHFIEKPQQSDA